MSIHRTHLLATHDQWDLNSKGQSRPTGRMQTWHSAGSNYTGRRANSVAQQHSVASCTQWPMASSVASCAMRLTLLTFDLLLRVCFFNLQRENVTSVKLNMKILLRIFCSVVGDDFLVSSGTRAFQEKPLDDNRRTGQWRVSVQVNLHYVPLHLAPHHRELRLWIA